jgi:hypothetical protein
VGVSASAKVGELIPPRLGPDASLTAEFHACSQGLSRSVAVSCPIEDRTHLGKLPFAPQHPTALRGRPNDHGTKGLLPVMPRYFPVPPVHW